MAQHQGRGRHHWKEPAVIMSISLWRPPPGPGQHHVLWRPCQMFHPTRRFLSEPRCQQSSSSMSRMVCAAERLQIARSCAASSPRDLQSSSSPNHANRSQAHLRAFCQRHRPSSWPFHIFIASWLLGFQHVPSGARAQDCVGNPNMFGHRLTASG